MVFFKAISGGDVVLRKVRGETTDTGEEATIRLLERGKKIEALPLESCPSLAPDHPHAAYRRFSFGHPHFPDDQRRRFPRLVWHAVEEGSEGGGRGNGRNAITATAYQGPMMAVLRRVLFARLLTRARASDSALPRWRCAAVMLAPLRPSGR